MQYHMYSTSRHREGKDGEGALINGRTRRQLLTLLDAPPRRLGRRSRRSRSPYVKGTSQCASGIQYQERRFFQAISKTVTNYQCRYYILLRLYYGHFIIIVRTHKFLFLFSSFSPLWVFLWPSVSLVQPLLADSH